MPIYVGIEGAERFRDLSKRLKEAGRGDLQKRLRRELKQAAKPTEAALRAAVMRVEVKSSQGGTARPDRSTNLRARIARSIGTSVTQRGIRIKARENRIGPYGASLARYLDATIRSKRRWRHPVFQQQGRDTAYVDQFGQPWFFTTINTHRRDYRRAIFRVMDEIEDELT